MTESSRLKHQKWIKDDYFITTDISQIPVDKLNAAFASKDIYWAVPLPTEVMHDTLKNSLCFSLFQTSSSNNNNNLEPKTENSSSVNEQQEGSSNSNFAGFARCITDFTTFIYLTDVYIWPEYQGKGLGKWLVSCVQEVIETMPYLRRSLCFTGDWERSVPFYEKLMGMEIIESGRVGDGDGNGRSGGGGGRGLAVLMRNGKGHPNNVGSLI